MSNPNACARAGQDRANLYNEITDKIIAELEAGRVPWVQPWGTAAAKAPLAMPKNASTNRQYSGVNILILWGVVIERGFTGQSWLTFRQALSLGGHVRKGERGTTVVYADRFVPNDEKRRAAELTNVDVRFVDWTPNPHAYHVAADLLVLPSVTRDRLVVPEGWFEASTNTAPWQEAR